MFEKAKVDLDQEDWVINEPNLIENGMIVPESMVRNPIAQRSNIVDDYGMEVPVQKVKHELNKRVRWMKCYAKLLSHMAGFAAINAGATMQQLPMFASSAWTALLPIFVIQLIILAVYELFGIMRWQSLAAAKLEGRAGRRAKLFHEEVFEAENDISGLAFSFLIVQVIRYALTGVLPNEEGLEEPEIEPENQSIASLLGIGVLFAIVACVLVALKSKQGRRHQHEEEEEEEEESAGGRSLLIALNAASMTFAWAVLWATRWVCVKVSFWDIHSIMGRVVMALALSAVSFIVLFGLDVVDDWQRGNEDFRAGAQAIQILVDSLGILIGFSWEHCFNRGVAAVASLSNHPKILQFIMGVLIGLLMTPMWSRHILSQEITLQKLKEDREKARARIKAGKTHFPSQELGVGGNVHDPLTAHAPGGHLCVRGAS